ncbi:TPA: 30S ribosomal protein S8 [Candidatus Micrarchaeota archaeon]|nr:MAG: 30S ribosomal protein S8 [Candidatus Micrarchaeota archaeon CG1_02_51_15]HII39141.1 30S ribosomal protein S8 [Candidatus Micrarchaeota archaeon]
MVDTLANALNAIKMAELKGKQSVRVKPASRTVREVVSVLQKYGYVGEFELVDDGKSGELIISLLGKVNNCGVVNPRYFVKKNDWEKYEQRYLPGRDVGLIIATTSSGVKAHAEAKEAQIGGKIMAFVY